MAAIDTAEDFRIGRVVSRLFNALFTNLATFLALAALLTVPMLLLTLYTTTHLAGVGINPAGGIVAGKGMSFFGLMMVQLIVYLVFSFLLQAALVYATISYLNDERPGFGRSLSRAMKSVVPLIVIAILSGVGVMLGMMLLVIPGILLGLMWAVVVPVLVVENTGITETFGRSRALTKGYRGRIFLLILMYFILAIAISFATRPLFGLSMITPKPGELSMPYTVVGWLEQVFMVAISSAGIASLYYELRLVKEGIGAQQLAEAFD